MILITTLVKSLSLVALMTIAGGTGYYFYSNSETQPTEPTELKAASINLKTHKSSGSEHHHHKNENIEHIKGEMDHDHEFHHVCDHGNYISDLELIVADVQEESPIEATLDHEVKLLSEHKQGNWQNLRIYADYTNLNVNSQQLYFIKNTLVKASIGFLESAYKVYPASSIKLSASCGKLAVPRNLQQGISGYDLALLITANAYPSDNFLARAGPCILDPKTLRPIGGTVEFNLSYLNKLNLANFSTKDKSWYSWVQTTIHEMTHVIGFSSALFPYYIDSTTNIKIGKDRVVKSINGRDFIIAPKVMERMRNHFGCQNVNGGPLENDGGQGTAGSHWERTTFGNEAMTGSNFPDSVFTGFTFALMESTGWYLADYAISEPFNWGEKEGCDIANGLCKNGKNEFCRQGEEGCSSDSMGIAQCSPQDPLAPGCGYWKGYGNGDCRYSSSMVDQVAQYTGGFVGTGSRCFISTIPLKVGFQGLNSLCYKATCSNNQIQFQVGSTSYSCSSEGQQVNVKFQRTSGTVRCPDVQRFCATTRSCPNDCSGVGTCRQTTCHCWKGYSGTDCSVSR